MARDYYGQPDRWQKEGDGRVICRKCKQERTRKRHDPCIADLPGVEYACCGHGATPGYIAFTDGRVIRGYFEVENE